MRVGEKEVSEQAAIVARFADLFSRPQLEALRESEEAAGDPDERERLYRLRKTCEAGIITAELAERCGQERLSAQLYANLGQIELSAADADAALASLERAVDIKHRHAQRGGRASVPLGFAYAVGCRGLARAYLGELQGADADLRAALGSIEGSGNAVEGSLLGLLSYPFVVEANLTLRQQGWLWAAGYAAFACGCGIVGARVRRVAAASAAVPQPEAGARPSIAHLARWTALAAAGSGGADERSMRRQPLRPAPRCQLGGQPPRQFGIGHSRGTDTDGDRPEGEAGPMLRNTRRSNGPSPRRTGAGCWTGGACAIGAAASVTTASTVSNRLERVMVYLALSSS